MATLVDPWLEAALAAVRQTSLPSLTNSTPFYDFFLSSLRPTAWEDAAIFGNLAGIAATRRAERQRQKELAEIRAKEPNGSQDSAGQAQSQSASSPPPKAVPTQGYATPPAQANAQSVGGTHPAISIGQQFVGRPYVFGGGRGTTKNFDCSAFVATVYGQLGKALTPFTDAMYQETVPVRDPQPGDLVFYYGDDPTQPGVRYPHVAIYVGGDKVLDASSSPAPGLPQGGVAVRPLARRGLVPIFRRVQ